MKYVVGLCLCLILLACSPPAPPTVSISVDPASVTQGQCATLTWSSTHASNVSIDQGVGGVDPNGSQQVCPPSTVQYTATATGDGGSGTAAATISVIAPVPVAKPQVTKLMVFEEAALFEFGKAELKPEGKDRIAAYREQAQGELTRADKVYITGYTDNVGPPEVNATLSLQRAEAVRDTLISLGADPSKFEVRGAGDEKPVADNTTDEGRAKNRRVEVEVVGVGEAS